MDSTDFGERGRKLINFIVQYHESISSLPVTPDVEPGYLKSLLPSEAPEKGEEWDSIMKDFEDIIMPGITHWLHPHFHAYIPSGFSYASLLSDVLCDGQGQLGFSWVASPALAELEVIVLDWFGEMIGLPESFLAHPENSRGGSVMQNSSSDCNYVSLLTARSVRIKEQQEKKTKIPIQVMATRMVAYCSKEAQASVEKVAMLSLVKLRILDTDNEYQLRGETLEEAIKKDIKDGLQPFFVVATLGTSSCASCDKLSELGPVCEKYKVWLHVDADYAGNALVCPEYRRMLDGIEYVSSFSMDPTKWLPINSEGAVMWVKNQDKLTQSFVVDPLYLQHQEKTGVDFRHWGVHLSRRFRALKFWFVMRLFGKKELRNFIQNHIALAKQFETLLKEDNRFEIMNNVDFGLVCFRLKNANVKTAKLLSTINKTKKLFLNSISLGGSFVIRFCVCYPQATEQDIKYAWDIIEECANILPEDEDVPDHHIVPDYSTIASSHLNFIND